ncbi:hypothetical protein QBC45DRAFT_428001 [Copromyces sp. CBS 386.78]|nr:hypothetical protein QBC45DRAFT_428001 [Copromyces sp. CBS 386.78]
METGAVQCRPHPVPIRTTFIPCHPGQTTSQDIRPHAKTNKDKPKQESGRPCSSIRLSIFNELHRTMVCRRRKRLSLLYGCTRKPWDDVGKGVKPHSGFRTGVSRALISADSSGVAPIVPLGKISTHMKRQRL